MLLETRKKLRRVGDVEDIPDILCLVSFLTRKKGIILFLGNIYEMSSDSCESQGSNDNDKASNDRKQNRQTEKRSLKEES